MSGDVLVERSWWVVGLGGGDGDFSLMEKLGGLSEGSEGFE